MTDHIITALNSTNAEEFVEYTAKIKPKRVHEKDPNAPSKDDIIKIVNTLEILEIRNDDSQAKNIQNNIINLMQSIEINNSLPESMIYNIFEVISGLCKSLTTIADETFLTLIKAWFHTYIITKKYSSLIKIYNTLFLDNMYCAENLKFMYVPDPPTDWIRDKIKEYNEQIENAVIRKNAKKPAPKYAANEIIGAKDKEGRWWMSKVLNVFDYQGNIVYFIEFIGWGEKFNEFISDGFRLCKFNPKKHKYFRPAWKPSE